MFLKTTQRPDHRHGRCRRRRSPLYWILNKIAELLPGRWEDRIKPYLYILPAYAAITLYLIYPAILTFIYSFKDSTSTEWVGFDNFTEPAHLARLPADAVQHAAVDHHRAGRDGRHRPRASPCWPTGSARGARSSPRP